MGYYTVIYGQIKGNEDETSGDDSSDSLDKIPLLQEKMEVWTVIIIIIIFSLFRVNKSSKEMVEEFIYLPELPPYHIVSNRSW